MWSPPNVEVAFLEAVSQRSASMQRSVWSLSLIMAPTNPLSRGGTSCGARGTAIQRPQHRSVLRHKCRDGPILKGVFVGSGDSWLGPGGLLLQQGEAMAGGPVASGIEAPGDIKSRGQRAAASAIHQKGNVFNVIILVARHKIEDHAPVLRFEIEHRRLELPHHQKSCAKL